MKTKIYITHAYGYERCDNYWLLNGKWSKAAVLRFIEKHYPAGLAGMLSATVTYLDDGCEVEIFEPLANEISEYIRAKNAARAAELEAAAIKLDSGDYSGITSVKTGAGRAYRGVMRLPDGTPSLHRVYAEELRNAGIEPNAINAVSALRAGIVNGVTQQAASMGLGYKAY